MCMRMVYYVCADGSCVFIVCWLCPHADDSASESSESELHGDAMSGSEVKQAEQRMNIIGSTTAPSGFTTTPS